MSANHYPEELCVERRIQWLVSYEEYVRQKDVSSAQHTPLVFNPAHLAYWLPNRNLLVDFEDASEGMETLIARGDFPASDVVPMRYSGLVSEKSKVPACTILVMETSASCQGEDSRVNALVSTTHTLIYC
jgi:hypothetical protein